MWFIGAVRVGVLLVVATGTFVIGDIEPSVTVYLIGFYLFGVCSALWYLVSFRWTRSASALATWAQLLVDFGVVAATVSFTGGPESLFTFLFVVVILETGLLLGLTQGFVIATLATAVMLLHILTYEGPPPTFAADARSSNLGLLTLWYGFSVQGLAYYLTASISGYWNQRVRRMLQFQRDILDNMNNGFLIVDHNGLVSVHNKAANRILDLSEGQAIGRPVQEVVRVEPGEECPIQTALRAERDFTRYEFHGLTATGRTKLLGLSTSRAYDWRGRLSYVIASFSDLTELAEMRREVQRQDRLAVVGELAAGLAHEIRNPVAAIRGAVDELRSNTGSADLVDRLASIAIRESDHLNRIVSDFLDFARNPEVRRAVFDIRELVDEVGGWLRRKYADANQVEIEVRSPPAPCMVSGDRSQLRQVFVNVGKNAVEANGMRGKVAICVSPAPASVEVRFDDEGPGIQPDEVARIFEPFYTTRESGVGMGLAVCQRIITAHDGVIRPTLREGGGTSMTVRLPAARAEE
ncbi:MAG: PAS domain S-box protein [Candidatus Hydrogenedentes bacterium]|nr:PAS domain S-box protein [Candidatus Hydrogenedentota bacterium]